MATSRERQGRPTQFHGVSIEERATDSHGNRLPWALEWADEHPNSRPQKRLLEEKGSFGKSMRRKGSSRTTKTQTPAKKENPALDGFEAALKVDANYDAQKSSQLNGQNVLDSGLASKISVSKEPTQVALFGFPSELQWAALNFYEKVSGGMICEDYARDPPAERRRYQSGLTVDPSLLRRALTKEERGLAMKYRGGAYWIKVTFDSREAADRAIGSSPHVISGYWVYARLFNGQAPAVEEPILHKEEDRQYGLLGAPKPPPNASSLGVLSGLLALQTRETAMTDSNTLPRSFTSENSVTVGYLGSKDDSSQSSVTASSATVVEPGEREIRYRNLKDGENAISKSPTFTHFPTTPRTVLIPANEALLPQLSWSEQFLRRLTQGGWIPGDVIGTEVPKNDKGEFDWNSATLYWRICYLIDCWLQTDLCGLRD